MFVAPKKPVYLEIKLFLNEIVLFLLNPRLTRLEVFSFFIIYKMPSSIQLTSEQIEQFQKAQCSKIGKKCNIKSRKIHFLPFQKWQKINFCIRKKFKTTKRHVFFSPKIAFLVISNFFLVQKLIFCHFSNGE